MCGRLASFVLLLMKVEAAPRLLLIGIKMFVKNLAHLTFRYSICCCEKWNCFGGVKFDLKLSCLVFD